MVGSRMKDVEARRFRHCTKKTGLERFLYRTVLSGNEVMECFVLKELKLTAGEMLRRKAVRDEVTRFDEEQQASNARFQSRARYYKWRENRGGKKDRVGRSGSSTRRGSPRKLETECRRKE